MHKRFSHDDLLLLAIGTSLLTSYLIIRLNWSRRFEGDSSKFTLHHHEIRGLIIQIKQADWTGLANYEVWSQTLCRWQGLHQESTRDYQEASGCLARNPNAKVIGVNAKFKLWRLWAKALGRWTRTDRGRYYCWHTHHICSYMVTNLFIISGVIRHWNGGTQRLPVHQSI